MSTKKTKQRLLEEIVKNTKKQRSLAKWMLGGALGFWLTYHLYENADAKLLWEFIKDPYGVGEIMPFSVTTGHAFVRPVVDWFVQGSDTNATLELLEGGAGTGGLTRSILATCKRYLAQYPNKTVNFTINELNVNFKDKLEALIKQYQDVDRLKITLVFGDMSDPKVPLQGPYQIILSSIPEQGLPFTVVRDILKRYKELAAPGGTIVRVRYVSRLTWFRPFYGTATYEQIKMVDQLQNAFVREYPTEVKTILDNIPPVNVFYSKKPL